MVALHQQTARSPTQRQPDRSGRFAAAIKHGRSLLKLRLTFFAAIAGVALAPATVNAAQSGKSSGYAAEHGVRATSGTKSHAHRSASKVHVGKRHAKHGTKVARSKGSKHAAARRSTGKVRVSTRRAPAASQSGIASIYSTREGTRTASGARLSDGALTAAHRSLPFGSKVYVTNTRNGKSVVVTITDRGPFIRGRIIDLTPAGARALGFNGLAPVTVRVAG